MKKSKSEKVKKLKIGEALRAAKAYEAVKAGAQHQAYEARPEAEGTSHAAIEL